jgi:uncharacterized membrane protein YdjX (TVP38/TMEM64 family)
MKKIISFLAIIFFILIFAWSIPFLNSEQFKLAVKNCGALAPVFIILYFIMADVIAPLVNTPVLLLSQAMFGIFNTLIFVYIAELISAIVCFYLSRQFGRVLVIKMVGKKTMIEIDRFTEISGHRVLILGRIFGNVISEIISYAFGLTDMKFKKFFLITVFYSAIPYLFLFFIFKFGNLPSWGNAAVWIGGIILVGAFFSYYIGKYLRTRKKQSA